MFTKRDFLRSAALAPIAAAAAKALLPTLFICAMIGSFLKVQAQEPPTIIQLPNDGANAVSKKYDHVHRTRYIELFLVGGNRVTGDLRANVYNTTYFNGWNETNKDSAHEALVDGLDYEKLAKQYGVFSFISTVRSYGCRIGLKFRLARFVILTVSGLHGSLMWTLKASV